MKARVGVVGYGVIGQRLTDGVIRQEDMELVGICDVAPTLSLRALVERGTPMDVYCALPDKIHDLEKIGVRVRGTLEDLIDKVDIILDATSAGSGKKNKELYMKHKKKAIFQGGEKGDVAEVFFHGYANYEKGLGKNYLKLTSCNTTGIIRAVDALDRAFGIERVVITIIRRVADPGDTHRGLVDLALIDPVPSHQATDLMEIMPHVQATGLLVHVPTSHGHIISILATPQRKVGVDNVLDVFAAHPRIRVVRIADGFNSNTALFRYARDLGNLRGDMYEIAVFEETVTLAGKDIFFAINVPQEAVVTPETIDGIRASLELQKTREEATSLTNKFLGLKPKGRVA
jgi:glyceraldehyde-3-phosphate dehydrogenase (NAD(P))